MGAPAEKLISEDEWQRRATANAISAAKQVVGGGVNPRTPLCNLSDIEWGWIVASVIFGWIKTRAEQAVAEGVSPEVTIRSANHRDPAPWEAGAVQTILPKLGDLQGVDWSKPVGEWSKDQITSFAWQIFKMTDGALATRDEGSHGTIVKFNREESERESSAAAGGPLLSRDELNDDIPF